MLVRISGVLLLILGLLIWTEQGAGGLVPIHTLLGVVLVLSMWVLAGVSTRAGVPVGLAAGVGVAALVVLILGVTQQRLLPAPGPHWVIQALHLLIGMFAVGSAEAIGGRLRRAREASATA